MRTALYEVFHDIESARAIRCAGGYGMSMDSRYNSRQLPGEVLVIAKNFRVVRERETIDALFDRKKAIILNK